MPQPQPHHAVMRRRSRTTTTSHPDRQTNHPDWRRPCHCSLPVLIVLLMQLMLWISNGTTVATAFGLDRFYTRQRWTSATVVQNSVTQQTSLSSSAGEDTATTPTTEAIRDWMRQSLERPGSEQSCRALRRLGALCRTRRAMSDDHIHDDVGDATTTTTASSTAVTRVRGLVSTTTSRRIQDYVRTWQDRGWLSTNPDSVDGKPSFHLNLVSNGVPYCDTLTARIMDNDDDDDDDDDDDEQSHRKVSIEFANALRDLYHLVEGPIYDTLLPKVRSLYQKSSSTVSSSSPTTPCLIVSDVFLRRYGDDILDGVARSGIGAHYDVTSRVTCVIALDDSAIHGTDGLYTIVPTTADTTGTTGSNARTTSARSVASNHAGLRRYVPLATGDAVMHAWDVLHGVDVQPGVDRTSLIVWFTEEERSNEAALHDDTKHADTRGAGVGATSSSLSSSTSLTAKEYAKDVENDSDPSVAPWLLPHRHGDVGAPADVTKFVLASALESLPTATTSESADEQQCEVSTNTRKPSNDGVPHPHDLYLEGARRENSFALTRLGSLCEDDALSSERQEILCEILQTLERRTPILPSLPLSTVSQHCWYQGSVCGNPLAQMALADDVMILSMELLPSDEAAASKARVVAATLFAAAAQQGHEAALEALERVVHMDATARGIDNAKDFSQLPLLQFVTKALDVDEEELDGAAD